MFDMPLVMLADTYAYARDVADTRRYTPMSMLISVMSRAMSHARVA